MGLGGPSSFAGVSCLMPVITICDRICTNLTLRTNIDFVFESIITAEVSLS